MAIELSPGFSDIYEFINYWQSGNDTHKGDGIELSEHARDDLAFAVQSINHMLATLRDIAAMTSETQNIYGAKTHARNALKEYGINE